MKQAFQNKTKKERNQYKIIFGHMNYGWHDMLDDAVYITFLRNPVERVASLYHYILKRPQHHFYQLIQKEQLTLDDFVKGNYSFETRNGMSKRLVADPFLDVDDETNLYQMVFENLNAFAFVGITKYFAESLIFLKREYGWNDICFHKRNSSSTEGQKNRSLLEEETIRQFNSIDTKVYTHFLNEFQQKITSEKTFIAKEKNT